MSVILSFNNFYPKYIKFLKSKDNTVIEGGIHIKLNYDSPYIDLTTVFIKTPPMCLPFGLCKYKNITFNDDKNKNKYYLDLSFSGIEKNIDLQLFYKKLEEFDNLVINYVLENKNLFNQYIDFDKNIENNYIPQIRYNFDKTTNKRLNDYPPTLKIKLSSDENNEFQVSFFDQNNKNHKINLFDLKGCKVISVLECNGIWFANGKFGITWKLTKLKIEKLPNRITKYKFLD